MYPVLFSIGTWEVRSAPFFLVLGILFGLLVGQREAKRVGYSNRDVFIFAALAVPVTLLLGTINSYIFDRIIYWEYTISFNLFQNGLTSFGVILSAFFVSWMQSLLIKKTVAKGLDVIALVLPLILAIYRIGCLLNGCCYGRPTQGFWGLFLPGSFGEWAYRYPTQIMYMVLDWAIFGFLWWRRTRTEFEGSQTLVFFLLFSSGRFLIDSFRDLPVVALGLSLHQLVSLCILLVTLTILLIRSISLHQKQKYRQ